MAAWPPAPRPSYPSRVARAALFRHVAFLGGQDAIDRVDLAQAGGDIFGAFRFHPGHLDIDGQLLRLVPAGTGADSGVTARRDEAALGEQLDDARQHAGLGTRSAEHTSELQSLMRSS